jgi:hypothetical protein
MSEIIRFAFPEESDYEEVEGDMALALFTSECIHGRPRTRLEVSYFVSTSGRRCLLSVRGPAGESALQVFAGLCEERFGEDGFSIERVSEGEPTS